MPDHLEAGPELNDHPSQSADSSPRPTGGAFTFQRRILRSAGSNWAGQFVVVVTGFLLTPFILGQIGSTGYGLWVLATSLSAYGSLLSLGMGSAVVKYVAQHRASDTMDEGSTIVSVALMLYALLGVLALGIASAFAPVVPHVFNVGVEYHRTAVWLTLLVGVQIGVSLVTSVPSSILRGLHRFDLSNVLLVAGTLSLAATTIVVLLAGGGILELIATTIVISLLMQVPAVWLVHREAPDLRFTPVFRRDRARQILGFSLSVFAARVSGILNTRTDVIILGAAAPVGMITPYALAQRLSEIVSLATSQFATVLLPAASELDARQQHAAMRSVYLTSSRISLAIALPLSASLWVLGPSLLTAWVGEEFARFGEIVTILATAALIDIFGWAGASLITGMGRHRPLAVMSLATGILNVILSIVLVGPLGLRGVALATLIAASAQTVLLVVPYTMRIMEVAPSSLLRSALLPTLPSLIVAIGLLILLRDVVGAESLPRLAAVVFIAHVGYFASYALIGASADERLFYRFVLANAISRLKKGASLLHGPSDRY